MEKRKNEKHKKEIEMCCDNPECIAEHLRNKMKNTKKETERKRNLKGTFKAIKEFHNAGAEGSVKFSVDTGKIQSIEPKDKSVRFGDMKTICDICKKEKPSADVFLDSNGINTCRDCIEKQCPAMKKLREMGAEWDIK